MHGKFAKIPCFWASGRRDPFARDCQLSHPVTPDIGSLRPTSSGSQFFSYIRELADHSASGQRLHNSVSTASFAKEVRSDSTDLTGAGSHKLMSECAQSVAVPLPMVPEIGGAVRSDTPACSVDLAVRDTVASAPGCRDTHLDRLNQKASSARHLRRLGGWSAVAA